MTSRRCTHEALGRIRQIAAAGRSGHPSAGDAWQHIYDLATDALSDRRQRPTLRWRDVSRPLLAAATFVAGTATLVGAVDAAWNLVAGFAPLFCLLAAVGGYSAVCERRRRRLGRRAADVGPLRPELRLVRGDALPSHRRGGVA